MLKKLLSVMLAALLINVAASAANAARFQDDEQARRIAKIKESVRKLGDGQDARVEVKFQNGKKLKGYIREATEDSFIVVEEKTWTVTIVTYSEITQVKDRNRRTPTKVGLNVAKGVGIVAGVVAVLGLIGYLFPGR